jgi:hypothetical protein
VTATPPQERGSSPRLSMGGRRSNETGSRLQSVSLARRSPDAHPDCATFPGHDAEAAAERELLRLCFVHAKAAAWAQWFYEEVYSRPGGKAAALAFYRDWEETQRQGGAA